MAKTPNSPDLPDDPTLPDLPDDPTLPDLPDDPTLPDEPDEPTLPDSPDLPKVGAAPKPATSASPGASTSAAPGTSSTTLTATQLSQMVLGIDSLVTSSKGILANAQSKDYLSGTPKFWGRYFYAPGQINSSGKKDSHYSAAENGLLRANNIRVLPVARQTGNVQNASKASADAKNNVAAIFEVFSPQYLSGADPDVLVFLDVEQDTPMVAAYYATWSKTIIDEANNVSNNRVRFHPAIYGSQGDSVTWNALKTAMANGAVCDGVWVARYFFPSSVPRPWSDQLTTPKVALTCPILAWQYFESPAHAPPDANLDTNLANPTHSDILLSRLIIPPLPPTS